MKKFLISLFRKRKIYTIVILCVCILSGCTQSRDNTELTNHGVENYKIRDEVYSFIGNEIGWKLTLDALYMTEDNGVTWKEVNTEDFIKEGGSTRNTIFFDNELGFILVANDQTDGTKLYITKDSGITFERVNVPVEQCENVVSNIEEYDYISTPFRNNDVIKIYVKKSNDDTDGELIFESRDWGDSWTYVGILDK